MNVKLIMAILSFFTVWLNTQAQKFIVSGEVTNMESGKIRIAYGGPGAKDFYVDSLDIKNGKFVYQGKLKEPHLVFFDFDVPEEDRMKGKFGFNLFLNTGSTNIKVDRNELNKPLVTGNSLHQSYLDISKNTNLFKRFSVVGLKSSKAWKERNQTAIDESNAERDIVMDSIAAYLFKDKGANKSAVVAYYTNYYLGMMNEPRLEKVLKSFTPTLQKSIYIKDMLGSLERAKKVRIGMIAPAFSLADTSGKFWTNTDYRGKYLLLDFGAAWCGWCKLETPFLLNAFNKFPKDKFEIVNIALDKTRESWVTDIKKENYPWISLSELKGWDGKLAKDYNIGGVPEIMLIGPDGKIIAKGLRGEQIVKEISKYLAPKNSFKVTGTVKGFPSISTIKIGYNGPGSDGFYKDSVVLKNGNFIYEGELSSPHLVTFTFDIPYKELKNVKGNGFSLFLDGQPIHINADRDSLGKTNIASSPLTADYYEILNNTKLFNKLNQLAQRSNKAWVDNDESAKISTKTERDALLDSLAEYLFDRKDANQSHAVAYFVYHNLSQMESPNLEKVLDKFTPELCNSLYLNPLVDDVNSEKRLRNGLPAPNFSLQDTAGTTWSLTDFKGKYVLLDFGASWCGWCKLEKPFLLDVFDKYKNKNFEIVNISMDVDQERWIKDIEQEKYPWRSISDLKGWKGNISKDYNIKGVPEIILIDPNGKIISRGLRGKEINKLISNYL